MKKLSLAVALLFLSTLTLKAQMGSNIKEIQANEINVETTMQALVTKPNGDYEVYRSTTGNVVMATVEKGNIKTVWVKDKKNIVIPSNTNRGGAICHISWTEKGGRKIRLRIKCPTWQ